MKTTTPISGWHRVALLPAFALATLLPAAAAAATGPKPWTLDDILAVRTVTDAQVSPDGRWVAYVVSALTNDGSDYQTDVWLAAVDGGAARRLTTSTFADTSPVFSPDGRWIAFTSQAGKSTDWWTNNYACIVAATGGEITNLLLPRQPHGPREPLLLRATMQWHLDWINKYTLDAAPAAAP
ncbi:MAG: PD40 domain-containing protein [Verrucomicrobia bacterium]|nr:PD40 domain-containing protein [Verrucomicrobiota bacterium]